ncbi:PepSY-like domain-containing protein [Brachyspira pilosicoli]|uniref:PepSY-like domain-containing protein n=1 Tax=Brachyspira pilosicoli TaxID=52584 RepID=UPI000E1396BF|nr:PepSY-like domain-containing protein [Brachyspira pilosicoli]SUW04854.1 putative periplasmic protein [Brachyspira pilosicoli]
MKRVLYIIFILSTIITSYAYCQTIAISEVPKSSIMFADKYFPDYYLYRAAKSSGGYVLIFKDGLRIYVNFNGDWHTISGGGDEISIDYIEEKIQNIVKKEFPDEKVIYIQKKSKEYKIQFKSRRKITVDFDGNITKGKRD